MNIKKQEPDCLNQNSLTSFGSKGLKKVLCLREVTFIAIGFMIGGGIFVFTGIVLKITGQALPLAYGLAVIPVFISVMPIAVLGVTIPSTQVKHDTHLSSFRCPGSDNACSGHLSTQVLHPIQRCCLNAISGFLLHDSGFWHQEQRRGQPLKKIVLRTPGPSCRQKC